MINSKTTQSCKNSADSLKENKFPLEVLCEMRIDEFTHLIKNSNEITPKAIYEFICCKLDKAYDEKDLYTLKQLLIINDIFLERIKSAG